QETLGGALAVAQGLPADLADAVRHAAGVAFTDGLHLAAYAAMAVMLLGAVTALVALRGVRPADSTALTAEPTGPVDTSLSSISR
ncbi:multidrug transporter, partial [Micromonospora sp. PSH25]|nr:multidrug transporter [Micromonospora foliorum]